MTRYPVAKRGVSGCVPVIRFGWNPSVGSGEDADIWDGPTSVWVPPTADRIHDIASSSASDSFGGTGIRTLRVSGVSGGVLVEEDIETNGTTPVPTVNAYSMIHRKRGLTGGSLGVAAGNIDATARVDGTVTARISAGDTQNEAAVFQIPDDYVGWLLKAVLRVGSNSGSSARVSGGIRMMEPGGLWIPIENLVVNNAGTPVDSRLWNEVAPQLPPRTYVKMRATPDANNTEIYGSFDILLEPWTDLAQGET